MGSPHSLLTVLVCAALLAAAAAARAWPDSAPGTGQGPDVLVTVQPQNESGEDFRQVIADAVRIKLESRGLAVAVPGKASGGPLEQARAGNAAVAIDCSYSVFGDEIAVSMGWYEARRGTRTARAEKSGRIGLRLDAVVLDALETILTASRERVLELAEARRTANAAIAAAGPQAGAGGGESGQTGSGPQGGGVGLPTGGLPTGGPPAEGPPARKKSPPQLLFVGGFAPFIATGAASYYFSLGYLPSLLVSVVFDSAAGRIGVGLYVGMNYFTAQGASDSSENFMIPVGVDVRYELALSRFLFSLHFTGGPAVLVVQTTSGPTYTNVMPFLKSGIGAEYLFTERIGISLMADYEIYFEVPYLFMGITPSLGMTFRL